MIVDIVQNAVLNAMVMTTFSGSPTRLIIYQTKPKIIIQALLEKQRARRYDRAKEIYKHREALTKRL